MTTRIKYLFYLLFISVHLTGLAQKRSDPSLEFGLSFSQLPGRSEPSVPQIDVHQKIRTNPLPGPVLGAYQTWNFHKGIRLRIGLQYQMAGTIKKTLSSSITYPDVTSKELETLVIHKICLPVSLGYEFIIKNVRSVAYLGPRPNLWLAASVRDKYTSSESEVKSIHKTNLFAGEENYTPPKRIINQISFGILTYIGQRLKAGINFSSGRNYYITTYIPSSLIPEDEKTAVAASDLIFMMQYDLHLKRR